MLLTTIEEIEAYLPTSKWDNPDALIPLVEEEENNAVVPVLGEELFAHLVEEYNTLVVEHPDITAASQTLAAEDVTDAVRLIRLCQKVQLYMALANNSGLLAVSFNGAGFNISSADGYDGAGKDALNRFERDAWKKAHRNIDAILTFLERDAKSDEPKFAEMWRHSRYFFEQGELLITTATELTRYLNIRDSREKYIEMVPDMKFCQESYIAPRIGEELLRAVVRAATDSTVVPAYKPAEEEEITEEQLLAKNGEIRGVWAELADRLRTALANYAQYRDEKARRADSWHDAELAMARAEQFVVDHQEMFRPYVESSPLYVPEPQPEESKPRRCAEKRERSSMLVLPHTMR